MTEEPGTMAAMTKAAPPTRLDHGVIGNGRVLALVAPTSAIERALRSDPSLALPDRAAGAVCVIDHAPGVVLTAAGASLMRGRAPGPIGLTPHLLECEMKAACAGRGAGFADAMIGSDRGAAVGPE